MQAAIGFRVHSGWAAMVTVAGTLRHLLVLDRRRIELVESRARGTKQPYHTARTMTLKQAEKFLAECRASAELLAQRALQATVAELIGKNIEVNCYAVLMGSGRPLPELARVLASHPMVHTAEGGHFRSAIIIAAQRCNLRLCQLPERDLYDQASKAAGRSVEATRRQMDGLRSVLGPPWTQDEKLAALAAGMALNSR
jgi:hypothetical protein